MTSSLVMISLKVQISDYEVPGLLISILFYLDKDSSIMIILLLSYGDRELDVKGHVFFICRELLLQFDHFG